MHEHFRRYAAALGGGIAAVILLLWYFGTFTASETAQVLKDLSDAFLAPAAVYLGIAALSAVSKTGAFDMLFYSMRNFFRLFRKNMEDPSLPKDFYEYYSERRKNPFTKWHLLFTGLAFFVLSILFAVIYLII